MAGHTTHSPPTAGPITMTHMPYYYVLAYMGKQCFRYYCQLDPESADMLHDVLVGKYDLVQVCPVKRSEVDPDILI